MPPRQPRVCSYAIATLKKIACHEFEVSFKVDYRFSGCCIRMSYKHLIVKFREQLRTLTFDCVIRTCRSRQSLVATKTSFDLIDQMHIQLPTTFKCHPSQKLESLRESRPAAARNICSPRFPHQLRLPHERNFSEHSATTIDHSEYDDRYAALTRWKTRLCTPRATSVAP